MKITKHKSGATNVDSLSTLINSLSTSKEFNPKSLISTVFGDLVVPYGGDIWVGSLAAVLAPLGINDRNVRTSLFRLSEQGWLKGTRSGRKSYYSLTDLGASQTSLAESLIYYHGETSWNGQWTLVFLVMKPVDVEARNQLEEELQWIGFGKVSHHVWAHPCIATDTVRDRVAALNLLDKVICMRCENVQGGVNGFELSDRDLASSCLPIAQVKVAYQTFIDRFEVFASKVTQMQSSELLSLRILLIDQYRKIVLNDPGLPLPLLPKDWNGEQAFKLVADIYTQIKAITDQQFLVLMEQALLNEFSQDYSQRFTQA